MQAIPKGPRTTPSDRMTHDVQCETKMPESKPYAEQFKDEVDAFFRLWKEKRWLAILFLVLLLGGGIYLLVGWLQRGSAIDDLERINRDQKTEISDLKRDLRSLESENKGLRETVAPLIARAAKEFPGEEINASLKKVIKQLEASDPRAQAIRTAEATIEIRLDSRPVAEGNKIGEGGYVAFAKGEHALLIMSTRESNVRWTGENESTFRCTVHADAMQEAIGKPMSVLRETDFLQVGFLAIKKDMMVKEGRVICTFNGAIQISFNIPSQKLSKDYAITRQVKEVIATALE